MKKLVKKIAVVLVDITLYQEREEFFQRIIKQLQTYRCTPIPGFHYKTNSPTIEAEFDICIFVETILEKNENIIQVTIVCRALHLSVEDLCRHLPTSSGPKLLAKLANSRVHT